jgi:hypothetical protein
MEIKACAIEFSPSRRDFPPVHMANPDGAIMSN